MSSPTLINALDAWKPFTALVVGDFMLDEQVHGEAERLSPDAPVPVLLVRSREFRPGGASNVCMDLAALGGRVTALGVIGEDVTGKRLRAALEREGVDSRGLVVCPSRPTTLKQSFIGLAQGRHPQKMFRVDEEVRGEIDADSRSAILRALERALPGVDVVIIEDYAKGVCSDELCRTIIDASRRAGKPVFVDPARGAPASRYRGATAITPNRSEGELLAGLASSPFNDDERNARLAEKLLREMELDAVVLTLDRHGAMLLERDGTPVSLPTRARQVYDVSGAGDMFIAGLSAARANGLSWSDSVRFANSAAGLEVEVFGVQPIPFERVRESVLREAGLLSSKLLTREEACREVERRRARGQRIVFTNGCFDVIHSGHVTLLEQAARCGDFLVVGLNSDDSVRRLKGPTRPINGEMDRARVLGAIEGVGCVVLFSKDAHGDDTPLDLIDALRPDVLVKGADYSKDRVVGADLVESRGGKVVLINLVEGRSTTGTIARMNARA